MSPELIIQLVVLQIVIFAALIFIFRRVMRGHTEMAVKRLQKLNEENLRREMELKRKLDEAEKNYKKRLSEAEKIGEQIKESAQKEALENRDRIINRANDERNEILADAREEAKEIKAQALKEIEISVLDKVDTVLKTALSQELNESLHNHFVDKAINELSSLKSQLNSADNKVLVASSYPLTTDQKKRLLSALNSKLSQKVTLEEKIENRYIAGVYLKIGDLVIDGTLHNKINHTITSLKDSISAKSGSV